MLDARKLSRTIEQLVEALVRGDYKAAEAFTGSHRLNATEIEQAIADYGRRLVTPPIDQPPRSVVPIEASLPEQWSVYIDLWTAEEGRSDLTLELTVTDSSSEFYGVQIDNIHVL